MPRLRSAPSAQQNASTKPSTRQALKEKTNTTSVNAQAYTEPRDFVKDARATRRRAKEAAQNDGELCMAGGLGQKSVAPPSEAPMSTDELAKSDGQSPPTAKANKRAPRQTRRPVQNEAQTKVFDDMKKRMRATAQNEAQDAIEDEHPRSENPGPSSDALPTKPQSARKSDKVVKERSEFSMSPSHPPSGKLNTVKNKRTSTARPDSVLKSQSTPQAETSVLALKNFKRRPRQPSMLAMMQQRAASARPSAAHVQATNDEAEDPSVFDIDGGDENEEEFAPEAEGTPLHLRRAKRVSGLSVRKLDSVTKPKAEALETGSSKKRKSDNLDMSSTSIGALRAKRQKSAAPEASAVNMDEANNSPASQASLSRQETPQPQRTQEVQVIGSSPLPSSLSEALSTDDRGRSPDVEVIVPSTEEQQQGQQDSTRRLPSNGPEDDEERVAANETMAEPASSSPLPEEPVATQGTDIMAEPLTQVTPPRPKRGREKEERKAKPMMTSTLQDLLPRRRQPLKPTHRKSDYDIDSDSDEDAQRGGDESEEDDGVSNRRRRQTKATAAKGRKSTAPTKKAPATRKSAAPPQSSRKSAAVPDRRRTTATSKKNPAKKGKTCGRAGASDKENDAANSDFEDLSDNDDSALPDTSITIHEAAQSGELAAQKAKFAEIDDWDMEFESMSFEEGRSSSQTWR